MTNPPTDSTAPRSGVAGVLLGTSMATMAVTLLTFVSGVLVARVLGPSARGEYGAILVIAQTAAGISALSFFDGALLIGRREESSLTERVSTLLATAASIGVLAAVVSSLVVANLPLELTNMTVFGAVQFTILVIAADFLTHMFSAVDRSEMRFFGLNFARVSSAAVFSLTVAIAWLFLRQELSLGVVLGLYLASKLPSYAYWIYRYRNSFRARISWDFARRSLSVGLKLHVAVVLTLMANQLDRLFAIGSWPPDVLGNYFVAFSAVGAGYSVLTPALSMVMFPYLAGLPRAERRQRISQALRVALLLIVVMVGVGAVALPVLIPLLYGTDYAQAATMAMGLLLALAPQPLRAIVLEAGRSLGLGRPSVEMAIASFLVMLIGFLVTGYRAPGALILAFGIANVASTLAGARHLLQNGDLKFDLSLVPGRGDLRLLRSILIRILKRDVGS